MPIYFSLILSLSPSHKPSLTKATLISLPGTERHLKLTSLVTSHRNNVCSNARARLTLSQRQKDNK